MVQLKTTAILAASLASAGSTKLHQRNTTSTGMASPSSGAASYGVSRNILLGASDQVLTFTYADNQFKLAHNASMPDTAPSWMLLDDRINKNKGHNLIVNDENSNLTRIYSYFNGALSDTYLTAANGSSGVVSYGFVSDKAYLLGASYSEGTVDVWKYDGVTPSLTLQKQITLEGSVGPGDSQGQHRAHQIVVDPTGAFVAVNDLGGDKIYIIDVKTLDTVNSIEANTSKATGTGPRHGAFINLNSKGGNKFPTHYAVVTELSNEVLLYEVCHDSNKAMTLERIQAISSYGAASPPANATSAAAGELLVAANNRDVYVTNRLSGNATDSISHFQISADSKTGVASLEFVDQVSTGGVSPRMLSFSADAAQSQVFVGNQMSGSAVVVLARDGKTGKLGDKEVACLAMEEVTSLAASEGAGPQFVLEI